MKFFILCSVIFVVAAAEIEVIRDKHNEQHLQSVNVARDELQKKLSKIEGKSGIYNGNQAAMYENSYSAGGSERLSSGHSGLGICSYCTTSDSLSSYNSRRQQSASSSNSNLRNSDYSGVGTVQHLDNRHAEDQDEEDVQSVVTPNYSRASSSQRSQHESDLSSVSSSAYRKAQLSEQNEDDLQRSVSSGYRYYPINDASTRTQHLSQSQRQSESSRSSSLVSEGDEQSRVQPTHRVSAYVRPGIPIRISVPGQGAVESSSRLDSSASASEMNSQSVYPDSNTQTYRVVYKPIYTYNPSSNYHGSASTLNSESDRSSSTSMRMNGVQKPEKLTNYDSFNNNQFSQSRQQTEETDSDTQRRVAPVIVQQPINGGSSRYSSQSQSQTQNSSSRSASSRPVSSTLNSNRASDSDYQASLHQGGSSGSSYYLPPSSASQFRSNSESQGQQQQRLLTNSGTFSPYLPQASQTYRVNQGRQQTFDNLRSRLDFGDHRDLKDYMSEAQRMANLQRGQVSNTATNNYDGSFDLNRKIHNTAANLDAASADFVRSSNLASRTSEFDTASADRNNLGNNGYQKVKSWSRQSQWASGSEYGPDGKPKTYSSLSTGESEKYNINGEEAGYKAATSTVEKDGKVSTYSIHT